MDSRRGIPLLHFYSMLNLAKALVYLEAPARLTKWEHFNHGLTDLARLKSADTFQLANESVQVRPGVFKTLHAVLAGREIPSRTSLNIKDLLAYCVWIGHEFQEVYREGNNLLHGKFQLRMDDNIQTAWVHARLPSNEVRAKCGSWGNFVARAPQFVTVFRRVQSSVKGEYHFESGSAKFSSKGRWRPASRTLGVQVRPVRLYRLLLHRPETYETEYLVPLQGLSHPLPEACVIYAISFHLSQLVRYQPHVYDAILGKGEAWLLEAFIKQCPTAFSHIMLNHLWRKEHQFVLP